MTKAKHLDVVSLWVPTHANMFVAIGTDDIPSVRCQDKVRQERDMSQDESASRWVLVD